jgi:hypothetical protein
MTALRLALGQALPVSLPSIPLDLSGVVGEIPPVADPVSRSVRVKLDLPAHGLLNAFFTATSMIGFMAVPVLYYRAHQSRG